MPGLFGTDTPRKLHAHLDKALRAFAEHPTEDGIFEVIFPLYHLREWTCLGGHESYRHVPEVERTPEQRLHSRLHTLEEYRVIRDLCNNAKHFEAKGALLETSVLEGLRVGYGRAGDSFGVTHFIVDGREIRKYFDAVAAEYHAYFNDS